MASSHEEDEEEKQCLASFAKMAELVPTLPLETRCPPLPLRQHGGFWLPEATLRRGVPAVHAVFAPRPTDVLLASYPKSGTTWLKALAFATAHRAVHPPSAHDHPLRRRNPHDCVPFLEIGFAFADDDADAVAAKLEELPAPRVLATHLPFSFLPERLRVVYICRDPKDALVSFWLFIRKSSESLGVDMESFPLQEALELFCEGRCFGGPQWRHVVEYWEASRRRRGTGGAGEQQVLFLRYEEMLRDAVGSLKTMAEFMGCAFSREEEERGVVEAIVELCSMEKLKEVEANRNGRTGLGVRGDAFFRKGVAGDWSSHMTPEMGKMVDQVVEDELRVRGSAFCFAGDGEPAPAASSIHTDLPPSFCTPPT
uniref:Uncharacterized protein n=1 Tax=Avena sativa TaxID=4498 RepID=A0ACD5TBA1_AVESA